jgi:hypothetical protein
MPQRASHVGSRWQKMALWREPRAESDGQDRVARNSSIPASSHACHSMLKMRENV